MEEGKGDLKLLQVFDGKPEDWPEWEERFLAVMDVSDLLEVLLPCCEA